MLTPTNLKPTGAVPVPQSHVLGMRQPPEALWPVEYFANDLFHRMAYHFQLSFDKLQLIRIPHTHTHTHTSLLLNNICTLPPPINPNRCGLALDAFMIPIAEEVYSDPNSISQPLYFINMHKFQWKENMKRMLPFAKPADENGMSSCKILTIE